MDLAEAFQPSGLLTPNSYRELHFNQIDSGGQT